MGIKNVYMHHQGVWPISLGWCTRCAKCEVQGSSLNMDSLGLPPLVTQGLKTHLVYKILVNI